MVTDTSLFSNIYFFIISILFVFFYTLILAYSWAFLFIGDLFIFEAQEIISNKISDLSKNTPL